MATCPDREGSARSREAREKPLARKSTIERALLNDFAPEG